MIARETVVSDELGISFNPTIERIKHTEFRELVDLARELAQKKHEASLSEYLEAVQARAESTDEPGMSIEEITTRHAVRGYMNGHLRLILVDDPGGLLGKHIDFIAWVARARTSEHYYAYSPLDARYQPREIAVEGGCRYLVHVRHSPSARWVAIIRELKHVPEEKPLECMAEVLMKVVEVFDLDISSVVTLKLGDDGSLTRIALQWLGDTPVCVRRAPSAEEHFLCREVMA